MSDDLLLVPRIRKVMDSYSEEEKELAISNVEVEICRLIASGKNDEEIFDFLGFEYREDWDWIESVREQLDEEYEKTKKETNSELELKIRRLMDLGCGDDEIISLLGLVDKKDKELVVFCRMMKKENSEKK